MSLWLTYFQWGLPKYLMCNYSCVKSHFLYFWASVLEGMNIWSNRLWISKILSVQFSSVAQSCLTLCDPMNRSMPGLPVHHQLPEFIQTHVHWIGDAIQPSHPLSSPSPLAPNPSQHQGLFQWVNSLHIKAAKFTLSLIQQSPYNHLMDYFFIWRSSFQSNLGNLSRGRPC